MKILLLGGSKSGKSMLAQRIIKQLSKKDGSKPYYWATMDPTDGEDLERIENHIREREGWGFETLECAVNIRSKFDELDKNSAVLFDSVTALAANEMFGTASTGYRDTPDESAAERTLCELCALMEKSKNTVLVCDEIFRDGRTFDEITENYRRRLAWICIKLAEECDCVCEVVCGRVKKHKGELPIIEE